MEDGEEEKNGKYESRRQNWVFSQKVARLYPACISSIARARYRVTAPHGVA